MKQLLAMLLAMVLIVSLAACGGGKPASESAAPASESASSAAPAESSSAAPESTAPLTEGAFTNSKVSKFFAAAADKGLHMVMKMQAEGQTFEVEEYVKGDKSCAVMQMNGEEMSTITDGTDCYQVIPSEKMVMKTSVNEAAAGIDAEQYIYADDVAIETGSEDYLGAAYDYERVTEGGEATTFYFTKGADTLRFIVSADSAIEIVSYDNNIPAGVFDIPADYQVMDMGDLSAMLGGSGVDLEGVDLEGVDLSGIDLSGVDLSGVDMSALEGLGG